MGALTKLAPDRGGAPAVGIDHHQYLTFMLGGEMFAVAILGVKEIIEYGGLTVVPMMPACIKGVINLRGAVVPVVDLARRFADRATEINRRSCIVIIETGGKDGGERQVVGVIVDAVNEVLEIRADQIEPPPAFGADIRSDFIAGMGRLESRFVIILNVDRVLAADDLAALARHPVDGPEPLALPGLAA